MTMQKRLCTRLTKWGGFALLVLALGLPAFTSQAGEIIAKGRNITHTVKSEWTEVSEGHVIGFLEADGTSLPEHCHISTTPNN